MILDRFAMTDKVAIVTGAGRGIGAATAVSLAEAGADVVISARTADQLGQVGRQIEAAGRRAVVVPADLSDLDAVAALVGHARDAFGRLDLVVNNVGGAMPRPFMDTSPGRLEQAFQFNVATAHALLRPAVPLMLEGGGGSAVNISSAMGRLSGRGYLAYGTAKGALAHYTRLAAADLSPQIRVNAIAVGSVATSALDIVMQTDELRMALEAGTPLKRIGDPNDIAAAVVYLASEAGSYITGKVLEVDGGIESPNLDMGLPDL
jgi:7-alpha-hydroxysteroid dehydrogenase